MTPQEQNRYNDAMKIITEVKSLRSMQKEYFKYRDSGTLNKCKLQEKKIDGLLDDFDKIKNQTLFP